MRYKAIRLFSLLALAAASAAVAPGCVNSAMAGKGLVVEQAAAIESDPVAPFTGFKELARPTVFPEPAVEVRVPVLMYHHVGALPADADSLRSGLTISEDTFRAQMDHLSRTGHNPVSQTQLYRALYKGEPLPPRPVLLTFDDGYADSYESVLPVLEEHSFPATFYVITGEVGVSGYMNWQQVIELDWKGMDIGSHTVSHRDLTVVSPEEAERQLGESAAVLAEKLGHPVYWLCYPSGSFNPGVENAVWKGGYLLAVTTSPGEVHSSERPLELKRYRIGPGTTMEEFADLVD